LPTAATAPCAQQLGIGLRGEGGTMRFFQALYRCDELFEPHPDSACGPGHGRHYHVADDKATFLIMQDSTRHWTLQRDGGAGRGHEGAVREDHRRAGEVRDALRRRLEAQPAARGRFAKTASSSPAMPCTSSSPPAASA